MEGANVWTYLYAPTNISLKVMEVPSTQSYFSLASSGTSSGFGIQPYLQECKIKCIYNNLDEIEYR